ncbi:hypothetical protein BKH40_03645 [Helicobacter sp. 11S02629-2]|nr:hypothetical protein BKH40_03645 [Helicobacter sp. 11S02629-2]
MSKKDPLYNSSNPDVVTQDKMSLRKEPLIATDVVLPEYSWTTKGPGEAVRIKRAYENAPPQIPHSTEGLLPITKDNNSCMGCHMPNVASSVGSTPIPKSHFFDFRRNKDDNGKLDGTRFVCTTCHVPQANAKPLVKNNFHPVFRDPKLINSSNLIKVISEGVNLKASK